MSSNLLGTSTLASNVTSITALGFWVLADDKEYFVPFADYPVFESASVTDIFNVQQIGSSQLYWPALDVDIELEALENPEQFPLAYQ